MTAVARRGYLLHLQGQNIAPNSRTHTPKTPREEQGKERREKKEKKTRLSGTEL
ncbi:hypothetical protein M406DRAFT_104462 [Cryphonectria parasitica EP155]|uniref:Uncharacterized protein n=1 Tax=Cryphonectria parasitica (strain ATCC 38755 / EP155) TaxID=660469 RepID=A0A9P4XZN0_CRYP1|nr:uncharacterized protein M406DRAFT_104462 [Cryphonectria parasitica EP155]KAF3763861.1 hypothetical protein M406DRAFT_104462 [Cryphonectria parasitica EP155]